MSENSISTATKKAGQKVKVTFKTRAPTRHAAASALQSSLA